MAQVALALVFLISSGLMIRTFQNLRNVEPGFSHPETVQTLRITIGPTQLPEPEPSRDANRHPPPAGAIPGVTSAAFVSNVPDRTSAREGHGQQRAGLWIQSFQSLRTIKLGRPDCFGPWARRSSRGAT